jgi:hypothetical protein
LDGFWSVRLSFPLSQIFSCSRLLFLILISFCISNSFSLFWLGSLGKIVDLKTKRHSNFGKNCLISSVSDCRPYSKIWFFCFWLQVLVICLKLSLNIFWFFAWAVFEKLLTLKKLFWAILEKIALFPQCQIVVPITKLHIFHHLFSVNFFISFWSKIVNFHLILQRWFLYLFIGGAESNGAGIITQEPNRYENYFYSDV